MDDQSDGFICCFRHFEASGKTRNVSDETVVSKNERTARESGFNGDQNIGPKGQKLYEELSKREPLTDYHAPYWDQARASQRLKEAGVPGVKYLDAGSRRKGEGSYNYVVFDDAMIDILRKYGLLPFIVGAGAASGPQPMPSHRRAALMQLMASHE